MQRIQQKEREIEKKGEGRYEKNIQKQKKKEARGRRE